MSAIVSEEAKRAEIREALELPPTAKASDVIKAVVDRSGHTVRLIELMELAAIMDGDVQLFVTDDVGSMTSEEREAQQNATGTPDRVDLQGQEGR